MPVILSDDVDRAITLARERFPNLCCPGILPRKATGAPVDRDDVAVALRALSRCRQTKVPTMHTHDLCRALGGLQVGAVVAAAVALGFDVRSWFGTKYFAPHALINVSKVDVKRHSIVTRPRQ